jgi:hypothetical protein
MSLTPELITLELNCCVIGEGRQHVFPVKVLNTETIGTLKKLIKEELTPQIGNSPPNSLVLWKVSSLMRDMRNIDIMSVKG